jgi:PAS domain S-box-containing protein
MDREDQLAAQNEELRRAQSELEASRNRYAQLYDRAPVGYLALDGRGCIMEINLTGARKLGVAREQLVGSQLSFFADGIVNLSLLLEHLRKCRSLQERVVTRLDLKVPGGVVLPVQLASAPERAEKGSLYFTTLTDLTEQAAAETALHHQEEALRRLNEELELRVQERTEALRKSENLKRGVFESIVAELVVLDAQGGILELNKAGIAPEESALFDIPPNSKNYLEICHRAAEEGVDGASQAAAGIAAVLGGNLQKFHTEYRRTVAEEDDRWFSLTVTPLAEAGGAVLLHEEISGRKNLERLILEISEKERRRIGQDLHDGLCQHLTGTALMAAALARSLSDGPEGGRASEIARFIRTAVEETRHVARGLHPVEIDAYGLSSALQELVDEVSRRMPCEFECGEDVDVGDSEVAVNFYRIAQEAVANALKHAAATRVSVSLQRSGNYLVLTVEDDGVGFQPLAESHKGMGFAIMRYRASTLGAKLDSMALPGGGVRVRCSLPLHLGRRSRSQAPGADPAAAGAPISALLTPSEAAVLADPAPVPPDSRTLRSAQG